MDEVQSFVFAAGILVGALVCAAGVLIGSRL